MNTLLHSLWVERLGWALIHSLWQGAILWSLVATTFALKPAKRHIIAWSALTILAFCPAVTFLVLGLEDPQTSTFSEAVPLSVNQAVGPVSSPAISPVVPVPTSPAVANYQASPQPLRWINFVVIAWAFGVVLLSLRLLAGWFWLKRLQTERQPLDVFWTQHFQDSSQGLALPFAKIFTSARLTIPLVIGWFKPVIYLPATMFSRMSTAEVDALFLHELAHLQRKDPLLQLWVTVLKTLFFYNPPAHLLARIARETSELATDDLVLEWQVNRQTYAQALARLEDIRADGLSLAASGHGNLKQRIQRILGLSPNVPRITAPQRFGIASLGGIALYLAVCGFGVPQIAKALTPEERVALLEQKAQEIQTLQDLENKPLKAEGQIRTPDGKPLPEQFAFNSWSYRQSAVYGAQRTKHFRATGTGERFRVGAWISGYAPTTVWTTTRDLETQKATFDLLLEKGFPSKLHVVDEAGNPISDVKIEGYVRMDAETNFSLQKPLTTDSQGNSTLGNVLESTEFRLLFFHHGHQWLVDTTVRFESDTPTVIVMPRASLITGTIIDAETKLPITGARAFCLKTASRSQARSFSGDGQGFPSLAASASDQNGQLSLDVCHPEDSYTVFFEAEGYGRKVLKMTGRSNTFQAALSPELRFTGLIKNPDKNGSSRYGSKSPLSFNFKSNEELQLFQIRKTFEETPEGIRFVFDKLSPGKIELRFQYGQPWESELKTSMTDLQFIATKDKLIRTDRKEISPEIKQRKINIQLKPPAGSPPVNDTISLVVNSKTLPFQVINNQLTIEVPPEQSFRIQCKEMSGYYFEPIDAQNVETIPSPFEIPLLPAGAIGGKFRWEKDLFVTPQLNLRCLLLERDNPSSDAKKLITHHLKSSVQNDSSFILPGGTRYFAPSLPLGLSYRLFAQSGTSFVEIGPIKLDDKQPLIDHEIVFKKGNTVQGKILQPDGTPFTGPLFLSYTSEDKQSYSTSISDIDPEGRFKILNINFSLKGQYSLQIEGSPGYIPQRVPITAASKNVSIKRQRGLVLEGRLIDLQGKPAPGVMLYSYRLSNQGFYTDDGFMTVSDEPTDTDGIFRFTQLTSGTYALGAQGAYDIVSSNPFRIKIPWDSTQRLELIVKKN